MRGRFCGPRAVGSRSLARPARCPQVQSRLWPTPCQPAISLRAGQVLSGDGHSYFPLRVGDSTLGVLVVASGSAGLMGNRWQKLEALAALVAIAINNVQLFREISERSMSDSLTGCFNHAHGLDMLDVEARRANRSRLPLSIIMFDIDHFKQVNDQHGHLCGDAVLVMVGRRLREFLRNSDMKCRYGGEEFLLILPDTSLRWRHARS